MPDSPGLVTATGSQMAFKPEESGNGGFRKFLDGVVIALAISGIAGGVNLYARQEVTEASLKEFKDAERSNRESLNAAIKEMRSEMNKGLEKLDAKIDRVIEQRR